MARTFVDLNDLVSTWKDKTNEISYKIGDLADLTTTGDSDLVQAINEIDSDLTSLQTQVNAFAFLDSAEVISLINDPANNILPIGTDNLADSCVTEAKMGNDAISSVQLKDLQTLIIYDSAGTTLKTLYTAGA
tara:strand:- start:544 stop:942 length:399 start_codon:yes stop_codon:yes gene_type:complete